MNLPQTSGPKFDPTSSHLLILGLTRTLNAFLFGFAILSLGSEFAGLFNNLPNDSGIGRVMLGLTLFQTLPGGFLLQTSQGFADAPVWAIIMVIGFAALICLTFAAWGDRILKQLTVMQQLAFVVSFFGLCVANFQISMFGFVLRLPYTFVSSSTSMEALKFQFIAVTTVLVLTLVNLAFYVLWDRHVRDKVAQFFCAIRWITAR